MQKTDRLKGKLHKLGHNGSDKLYIASFDITEDIVCKNGETLHLAFSENSVGSTNVTLYRLDCVPTVAHITRTFSEILTNVSEDYSGREVFTYRFLRTLNFLGLSREKFQDLVRRASQEMDLL